MNDHEIEATLRATLAGRAATVAAGPVWAESEDAELLEVRRRPRRPKRWAPLAAAAAVLLAVGGAIVGAQQLAGTGRPDATHVPAEPTPMIRRLSCTAGVPPTWRSAIAAATTSYGTLQLNMAGVTSDGTEIVDYSPPDTPAGTTSVAIGTLAPGASTPHTLATFSRHGADGAVYNIQVDGTIALVSLDFGHGRDGIDGAPSEIVVVDTRTGAKTVLLNLHGTHRPTTDAVYLLDGSVYWDEYPHTGAPREIVHRYDLATRTGHIVYDGMQGDQLQQSAAGIWWTGTSTAPNVPARLPAEVAQYATSAAARESLISDGTAFAWRSGRTIGWWTPGGPVVETRVAADGVNGVAGPLIFFNRANDGHLVRILDTRTGATTTLAHTGLQRTWRGVAFTAPEVTMITDRTSFSITRLATAALPPLHC